MFFWFFPLPLLFHTVVGWIFTVTANRLFGGLTNYLRIKPDMHTSTWMATKDIMEGHHRDTILENGVWLLGQEEMNISKLSFRVKVFLLSEKNIPDVFGASSAKNNVQKLKILFLWELLSNWPITIASQWANLLFSVWFMSSRGHAKLLSRTILLLRIRLSCVGSGNGFRPWLYPASLGPPTSSSCLWHSCWWYL